MKVTVQCNQYSSPATKNCLSRFYAVFKTADAAPKCLTAVSGDFNHVITALPTFKQGIQDTGPALCRGLSGSCTKQGMPWHIQQLQQVVLPADQLPGEAGSLWHLFKASLDPLQFAKLHVSLCDAHHGGITGTSPPSVHSLHFRFRQNFRSCYLQWFSDDSSLVGCISEGKEAECTNTADSPISMGGSTCS